MNWLLRENREMSLLEKMDRVFSPALKLLYVLC